MSPRPAVPSVEPEAQVIRWCRNCQRPIESGRQVFCSTSCIEATDQRAATVGSHLALLQRQYDQESAAVEVEIAQFAADRRRILRGRREDLMAMSAKMAPLRTALDEAKAAGEIWFELAADRPADAGWR